MSEIELDDLCPICKHLSSTIGAYILRLDDLEASAEYMLLCSFVARLKPV
jgi:hypothetical protein